MERSVLGRRRSVPHHVRARRKDGGKIWPGQHAGRAGQLGWEWRNWRLCRAPTHRDWRLRRALTHRGPVAPHRSAMQLRSSGLERIMTGVLRCDALFRITDSWLAAADWAVARADALFLPGYGQALTCPSISPGGNRKRTKHRHVTKALTPWQARGRQTSISFQTRRLCNES